MECIENIDVKNKKKNRALILCILWVIAIIGFVVGIIYIFYNKEQHLDFINEWFEKILQQKSTAKFGMVFLHNIYSTLVYILVIFFLGFSPVLSLVIYLVPFIKGIGIGLHISYIYINYGHRGILYESLIDIPIIVMLVTMIIFSAKESIKFSNNIRFLITNTKKSNINLKKYCFKYILIFVVVVILCLIHTLLDFYFFCYFNII